MLHQLTNSNWSYINRKYGTTWFNVQKHIAQMTGLSIVARYTNQFAWPSLSAPGSGWMAFGLRRAKVLGYMSVQLVSKISNLSK